MGAAKKIDLIRREKRGEGVMAQCQAEAARPKMTG